MEHSKSKTTSDGLILQRVAGPNGLALQRADMPQDGVVQCAEVLQRGSCFSTESSGEKKSGKGKKKITKKNDDDDDIPDFSGSFDLGDSDDVIVLSDVKGAPFEGRLNPQPKSLLPDEEQQEGQRAAQEFIDGIGVEVLIDLRGETVAESALNPEVHNILIAAMKVWAKRQPYPGMYKDLEDKEIFGISGNCMDVSPVFGYLLNKIHDEKMVRVHRQGGKVGGPHTMLMTGQDQYIDPTWRQGLSDGRLGDDPHLEKKKKLKMVRIFDDEPTMDYLNKLVSEELEL